jgi:hypothetical protein
MTVHFFAFRYVLPDIDSFDKIAPGSESVSPTLHGVLVSAQLRYLEFTGPAVVSKRFIR